MEYLFVSNIFIIIYKQGKNESDRNKLSTFLQTE